jgi:hypothetical protein
VDQRNHVQEKKGSKVASNFCSALTEQDRGNDPMQFAADPIRILGEDVQDRGNDS